MRLDGGGNGGRSLGLLPANLRLLGSEGLEPEPEPELRVCETDSADLLFGKLLGKRERERVRE